jgi:PAS domain S-box-containing protein
MSLTSLADLRIIDVNKCFLELGGHQREDVIGRSASDLDLWGSAAAQDSFLETVGRERSLRDQEIQVVDKEGVTRTYQISAEIINLQGEECILSLTNDITEHRALEEQLRQAQRMESIGQLAGGVAHDFNNLLTAITGYSEISLRRLGIHHPVSKNIEQIRKAGTRAASLTRQLFAFSRRQMLQPRLLDLNALVSDMNSMLQRLIGEDIDLITILKSDLGQIKADPGQIEQVVMNLVVNARDAMPRGGMITIETTNVDLDRFYSRSHVSAVPGPCVLLAITDTGAGIDAATQKRIFEPFFTTKEIGKGTGLGLSTVYGIVKQSDGYIWVYSEVGKGTTFKVYLPRVDESEEAEPIGALQPEALSGRETVLIVEDEDQLRDLAQQILEENGYSVFTAANGADGLRVCEEFRGRFDLVITDVVMPLMSGTELAEKMAPLQPQAKVLYMSGYTNDSMVRHGVLEQQVLFLQKPFTPASFARKVREVLDGRSDKSAEP